MNTILKRQIIVTAIGVGILGLGMVIKSVLADKKNKRSKQISTQVPVVFSKRILNDDIPIYISNSGKVTAKYKIQLTSEVTGILRSPEFEEGAEYEFGSDIIQIESETYEASVKAKRSDFYAQLLKVIPIMKTDYSKYWKKWDNYLKSIDIEREMPPLPSFQSKREKNFIISKGLQMAYQTIKNMELQKEKYAIKAPFNGALSETLIQNGELVRSGQPVGTFQSTEVYELVLQVQKKYLELLDVDNQVVLTNLEKDKGYVGVVTRINPAVERKTQTARVYIEVNAQDLKEGSYLMANIEANPVENAVRINRTLLDEKERIYYVRPDSILAKLKVEPVYFENYTVVVKGIPDGTPILSKVLPTAYEGMEVSPISEIENK